MGLAIYAYGFVCTYCFVAGTMEEKERSVFVLVLFSAVWPIGLAFVAGCTVLKITRIRRLLESRQDR